jgi:hypothetical protein
MGEAEASAACVALLPIGLCASFGADLAGHFAIGGTDNHALRAGFRITW